MRKEIRLMPFNNNSVTIEYPLKKAGFLALLFNIRSIIVQTAFGRSMDGLSCDLWKAFQALYECPFKGPLNGRYKKSIKIAIKSIERNSKIA